MAYDTARRCSAVRDEEISGGLNQSDYFGHNLTGGRTRFFDLLFLFIQIQCITTFGLEEWFIPLLCQMSSRREAARRRTISEVGWKIGRRHNEEDRKKTDKNGKKETVREEQRREKWQQETVREKQRRQKCKE